MIKYDSILSLTRCYKRCENDFANRLREKVFQRLINMNNNDELLKNNDYSSDWLKFKDEGLKLKKAICSNYNIDDFTLEHIGGQKNYDFIAKSNISNRTKDNIIKLEYKHQSSFKKLPQILAVSNISNPFFKESYWEYYFNYTIPILKNKLISELPIITIDEYVNVCRKSLTTKLLKSNNFRKNLNTNVLDFFDKLWELSINKDLKSRYNKIIQESIDTYLHKHQTCITKEFIKNIESLVKEKQSDKYFIFWQGTKSSPYWKVESLPDSLELTGEYSFKKNKQNKTHTIQLNTINGNTLDLYLRWKNHQGVSNPAWQIKLNIKN